MEKLSNKKSINSLTILLAFTYMVSYLTRINYGAVISEMVSNTGFSKSLLSMALTGSFITYGVGQIISGIIGDRVSPKKLVTLGLCITVCMNALIPFCANPYQMTVVWCINGFAQSFMWPPIVRIMSSSLNQNDYNSAVTKVSWGSSLGTILVYLISPIFISVSGWKSIFIFAAVCGIAAMLIWTKFAPSIQTEISKENQGEEKRSGKISTLITPLIIFIMISIVLQGSLRDGVTTWMPSYIADTYNLSNIISILTGVILPIFGILSFQFASILYSKKITNPLTCAGVFFALGSISAAGVFISSGKSAAISVVFSALLTGSMHAVNLILICMIPSFFEKTGMVATASGLLNSCTYIGSAVSTYGIAVLSEKCGWNVTVIVWIAIAFLGAVICFSCAKAWQSRFPRI